jgi:hypothetical protein
MSKSVDIELGDDCYTVECTSYSGGSKGTFDDPPEGPDVDLGPVVKLFNADGGPNKYVKMTLDAFTGLYASYHDLSISDAYNTLHDEVLEAVEEQLSADYDDAVMSREEDDY